MGKDGTAVQLNCAFVPAGPYSCDTGGDLLGWDPRFVSYSTFMDAMALCAIELLPLPDQVVVQLHQAGHVLLCRDVKPVNVPDQGRFGG